MHLFMKSMLLKGLKDSETFTQFIKCLNYMCMKFHMDTLKNGREIKFLINSTELFEPPAVHIVIK